MLFESAMEDQSGSDTPVLGDLQKEKHIRDKYRTSTVKYYCGCVNVPADCAKIEYLMTSSVRCQGNLRAPGDVMVIEEKSTFDKDGAYHVAIKYLTIVPDTREEIAAALKAGSPEGMDI